MASTRLTDQQLAFFETFGMYGYLQKLRSESMRDIGAPLAPFNAFLFLLGLETLSLRMERHVQNALGVARFLQDNGLIIVSVVAGVFVIGLAIYLLFKKGRAAVQQGKDAQ